MVVRARQHDAEARAYRQWKSACNAAAQEEACHAAAVTLMKQFFARQQKKGQAKAQLLVAMAHIEDHALDKALAATKVSRLLALELPPPRMSSWDCFLQWMATYVSI